MFSVSHSCYFKYPSLTFTQSVSIFLLSLLLHSCYAPSLYFYPGSSSFCVFFAAAVVFSYTLCTHFFTFFYPTFHFISFRWLNILFINRFMTLQGTVYVGALLAISGLIIMFFKRPLFFSFSFFFVIFVEFSSLLCSTYAFVVIFVYVILIRHMTKILVK